MGIFKIDVGSDKLKQLEQQIEERLKQRKKEHGDYIARENELAAPVVNYSDVEMEKYHTSSSKRGITLRFSRRRISSLPNVHHA